MNVLFYRYNSICEPLFIGELKRLGVNVLEEKSEMTNKEVTASELMKNVSKILDSNKVLFVMTINYFPTLSAVCNIYNIPYVSIIVDSPLMELYSDTIKNPCNRVFIFDRNLYLRHVNDNPDCIFHMPLVADIEGMQNVIKRNQHLKSKYASDVSFIGSLYTEKCPYNKIHTWKPYTKGFFDGLIESQIKIYGYNMLYDLIPDSMLEEFKQVDGIYRFPEKAREDYRALLAYNYLGVKVSELERIRLLGMISEKYNVDLYTGSDTSCIPKVHNKGLATSLFDMPLIFNNSKINLQITARTIETGLSQRVWDVLSSGGFLLMNYQEELFDYFEPGTDMDYFESPEDMMAKIDFYLAHDDIREQVARNGFEKVSKLHTPQIRMKSILERI